MQRYDKGNTPYDVYVKLDIPQKEAEEYQVEYWKLRRMYELEQIYNDNKDSLPLIIRMFQEMKARNISLDQLTRATILVNSLPQLYNQVLRNSERNRSHQSGLSTATRGTMEY